MKWIVELRASEHPEEWVPLRKEGGNSLTFHNRELAQRRLDLLLQRQPHVPARVVTVYG